MYLIFIDQIRNKSFFSFLKPQVFYELSLVVFYITWFFLKNFIYELKITVEQQCLESELWLFVDI